MGGVGGGAGWILHTFSGQGISFFGLTVICVMNKSGSRTEEGEGAFEAGVKGEGAGRIVD